LTQPIENIFVNAGIQESNADKRIKIDWLSTSWFLLEWTLTINNFVSHWGES